ncbi:MAG: GNAT family N-acetyltransferase [Bacteroidota bacterium]|nr:GNAT family N-acetyltransferase [Bacteroidota bacterium]
MKTWNESGWQIFATSDTDPQIFCSKFSKDFGKVTKNAFLNTVNFNKREVKASLAISTHVGIIREGESIVGFTFLSVNKELLLNGKMVLWINKIAISKQAQGRGLGVARLMQDLHQVIDISQLGYVGCCTQNNSLINSLSGLGCRSYPITEKYGTPAGVAVWTYLTLNVNQIKRRLLENFRHLDELLMCHYGIIKHGFSHCINVSQYPLRPEIRQTLNSVNFDQANGDLLIMLTQLR